MGKFHQIIILTESRAAKKVDNMIQDMASQNLTSLSEDGDTITSFSVVSLDCSCGMS